MHYIDNKKTPTMINSWYLNGFNKQTLISGEDSSFPLFLDKLNITAKVEFISYVSQSKRLFFVVPEFPNRIYSCFIGEYLSEIQPNFITFEEGENDIISIENISGKIIAFASSSKHLFFLTCNIGRRGTESSYTLHMYDTDQETGFGMERIESIVDFPDLLPINNKPFCFSVAERRIGGGYRIYFYGEGLNGTIMFANFSSQPKINPRLLKLKKIFGEIPKINFVHSIDNSKQKAIKSLKPSTLLVVDATQNHIYIINHYKENEVKMIPLGRIAPKDTDITITAVSRLKFLLKEQKINSKN
ncbi:MAG: hypothetical protein JJV91_01035 [Desulfosarcina sp.]|nr:hypothetical protein [Desulfobacterales bacterium]